MKFPLIAFVMAATTFAAKPDLARIERVRDAIVDQTLADFPMSSVGWGKANDEFAILIGAPNAATLSALEQRYPKGTRLDGVLVECYLAGEARLHGDTACGEALKRPPGTP